VVDRTLLASSKRGPPAEDMDREARIRARIRRVRSDPRWRPSKEDSNAA